MSVHASTCAFCMLTAHGRTSIGSLFTLQFYLLTIQVSEVDARSIVTINFSNLQCEHMLQDDASASSDTKWYKNTHNKHIHTHTHTHTHSYWFAIQCFFGHAGCSSTPGIRGTAFITMYLLSYIGSGFLLRYAEGATYLAVVQVISGVLAMSDLLAMYQQLIASFPFEKYFRQACERGYSV